MDGGIRKHAVGGLVAVVVVNNEARIEGAGGGKLKILIGFLMASMRVLGKIDGGAVRGGFAAV